MTTLITKYIYIYLGLLDNEITEENINVKVDLYCIVFYLLCMF